MKPNEKDHTTEDEQLFSQEEFEQAQQQMDQEIDDVNYLISEDNLDEEDNLIIWFPPRQNPAKKKMGRPPKTREKKKTSTKKGSEK